jgi:hypothetical protein
MKYREIGILLLLLAGLSVPVHAADEYRYSYFTIDKIDVELVNDKMFIGIDYTLDPPIKVLIYLLGNKDLSTKLLKVVNYQNATLTRIEMHHAQFEVDHAVIDYGDGAMWLPEHQFNAVTPVLTINTPRGTVRYTHTNGFSKGVGYFRVIP